MGNLTSRVFVPLALLVIACAAAFLLLAAAVSRQGWIVFDEPVVAFVTRLGITTDAWRAVTDLGSRGLLVVIGIGMVLWLVGLHRPAEAIVVAVAVIGASLFTDVVKEVIARPRPPGPYGDVAAGYSFPSGHALNSTATYGLVALGAWRSRLAPAVRRAAVAVVLAIPLLVGLSRVALGVHYPSDVLGGWLAGMAMVFAVAAIAGALTARRETARPGP